MKQLNPEIIEILNKQSDKTLAEWWCTLNNHQRPIELSIVLEKDVWPTMCYIHDKISIKECLREHNKDSMSSDEFEEWSSRVFDNSDIRI